MAPSGGPVVAIESQWLAQLNAMRRGIAELRLPQENGEIKPYGQDIIVDDDFCAKSSSDDLWDLISDGDDDFSKDQIRRDQPQHLSNGGPSAKVYDVQWLASRCSDSAAQNGGLDADELQGQVLAILNTDGSDEELQAILADTLGYDELDFVEELISHRDALVKSASHVSPADSASVGLLTKAEREEVLRRQDAEHKSAPIAQAMSRGEVAYPHVYNANTSGSSLSVNGRKYALPLGSQREIHEKYEEYSIPAAKIGVLGKGRKLLKVIEMDGLCKRTFKGYQNLNRMQSLVYPVAYQTSENMLICAPTGAGKTDAAMLTILNTIAKNITPNPLESPDSSEYSLDSDAFKIIYVAPMKALAAEITGKLGKRLAWLGVQVRELTGDMHLTKAEIIQTQIIVTTPEKWDVVTRKSTGDTELVQKVRLLIIDEVHMLHDERGAVLESLVARTQRQVESTQSLIRIIGLSATLPNYVDVADFLKVNRMVGMFYFDASFRPVPLEQHFIGVKGKAGSKISKDNIEHVAFETVRKMLELGHQVMVFVHSRKDTFATAKHLYEMATDDGCTDLFNPTGHASYDQAVRDMKTSRGRELRELLPKGMGTHHAGMARSDRNLVERLFADGVMKVLCCTATLAWGVNLPAAAVIIKGTQLYSAEEGKFIDLGILDVLQIFGRAGRPQFQDTGIGFICTTHDKLQHYLTAVTQQQPIESKFAKRLVDNLNAEISLGTVTSVSEAVQWLGYSYLFVRMRRNAQYYGIDWAESLEDPQLVQRRRKLVEDAALVLQQSQMIIYNKITEELRAKDIGRIASQFYVLQTSVQIFNRMMSPQAGEADVLKMISMSGEFDQIQSRDNEAKELYHLKNDAAPCQIDSGIDSSHGKTNILLQSYISRARLEDFALVSDSAYVAQNAARICRALFMTALNRRWGFQCLVLLSMCKSIEKRIWPYQHPFHQFDLPIPVLKNLDDKGSSATVEALREMNPSEIGELVHNRKMGSTISKLLDNFPTVSIEVEIAPLNRDVLRVHLYLTPEFKWNDRHHGNSESYWVWIENSETSEIYHHEIFLLTRRKVYDDHELNFTIPLSDPIPTQIYVRIVSDRWLGAETVTAVSFQHLIRPDTESFYTNLLNLQPLSISALKNPILEEIYGQRFQFFNPMQSQIFHCIYHTSANVLLGSPTGSGKTVAAELAMWWAFREKPGSKVVYIAPMKALVRERVQDWRERLAIPMGIKLVELTGDNTPDTRTIRDADVIITTPEKWDGISRSWQTRSYVRQVSLVIIDEIHLLGGDRGPVLEILVSRMNYIASQKKGSLRLLGMSTACANAMDLANWLGVNEGVFNFRHSVRPVPLEIYIDGFPEVRGFCPLMQSMNRPTFLAIKTHSPDKPVIVFVASRRQTRLTAKDLINFCGMEDRPRRFVRMSDEDLSLNLSRVKDDALREALSFGIGLHHAGLIESDRQLAEELFAYNKIQILVATSTLAWGVNLPAHLVVVKGTQFFDAKTEGYKDMDLTDVLQMLGRAGRPQFDTSGIARIFTQDAKKSFYKHFLHTGFPVESSLHKVLDNHLAAEISATTVATKQDALDYLTWTFFFRRIHKNPSYYGLEISPEEHSTMTGQERANDYLVNVVDTSLLELSHSSCIEIHSNGDVDPTPFGKIMSYYYLSHKTIRHLLEHAHEGATFEEALTWISRASEFDELPVRHNEDLINSELSRNLPLSAEGFEMPLWDPHVKAFLLLQAHFSRIDLPISDYVGDQKSVLDQSIRVIQASIDVMAELGHTSSCVQMMTLLQCVKSAKWPEDQISTLLGSELWSKSGKISPISDVAGRSLNETDNTLETNKTQADSSKIQSSRGVATVPKLEVNVTEVAAHSITVELVRINATTSDYRMRAPRFPKPQTEGFFIVVTDSATNELGALKRVSWPSRDQPKPSMSKPRAKSVIKLPTHEEARKFDVIVVSDGYVKMTWKGPGVEILAPPLVVDSGEKKPKSS